MQLLVVLQMVKIELEGVLPFPPLLLSLRVILMPLFSHLMPLPLRGKLPLLLLALLRVMNQRVLTDMGSLDETAGSTY